MRVHELRALAAKLADADPDAQVVVNEAAGYVLVLKVRPGMHQPMEDVEEFFSEQDRLFLRALRIPS